MAFNIDNIFKQKTVTLNCNNITQHCYFYCFFLLNIGSLGETSYRPQTFFGRVCLSFTAVSPSLPFRWRPLQVSWLWTGTDSPPSSLKILNSSTRVSTTTDRSFSRTYNTNIPFSMWITYILYKSPNGTPWGGHVCSVLFYLLLSFFLSITFLSFYIVTAFFYFCYQHLLPNTTTTNAIH